MLAPPRNYPAYWRNCLNRRDFPGPSVNGAQYCRTSGPNVWKERAGNDTAPCGLLAHRAPCLGGRPSMLRCAASRVYREGWGDKNTINCATSWLRFLSDLLHPIIRMGPENWFQNPVRVVSRTTTHLSSRHQHRRLRYRDFNLATGDGYGVPVVEPSVTTWAMAPWNGSFTTASSLVHMMTALSPPRPPNM